MRGILFKFGRPGGPNGASTGFVVAEKAMRRPERRKEVGMYS
jgi:hypothetical protein